MSQTGGAPSGDFRERVVLAGASGFVGRALAAALSPRYVIAGTSRRPAAARSPKPAYELCAIWRSDTPSRLVQSYLVLFDEPATPRRPRGTRSPVDERGRPR